MVERERERRWVNRVTKEQKTERERIDRERKRDRLVVPHTFLRLISILEVSTLSKQFFKKIFKLLSIIF